MQLIHDKAAELPITMCRNGLILPILFFGTLFCVAGIVLYRVCARFLLNKLWMKWYIRRAVDASIIGFFALVYFGCAYERVSSGYIADVVGPQGYDLIASTREFLNLNNLLVLQWFVNNVGNYVIYPAFAITVIGFAIERTRQQQATASVHEITQKIMLKLQMVARSMNKLAPSGTKWRGMTASSLFQVPGVMLLIVIGLTIAVTMLTTGYQTELKSTPKASPKYSQTPSSGK